MKIYVPQPYPVEKKIPVPVEVKFKDHNHHPHHHYSSMDDHHGYLENKFHEETAASNDQHSLTSVQRHSITVINPNDRHREQMKHFQREQHHIDAQFQESKQQQEKLNENVRKYDEKFKIYKKSQQQQHDQQQKDIQVQQHQLQQIQHQMQVEQQMQDQQQQLQSHSIHGLFGQKMYNDFAKPFFGTEHQHQSILTLQTHLLQNERDKPSKNLIPEFKPIANIRSIPIEHQPLQHTQQLYPLSMDEQGASSNVEPVAVEPPSETNKSSDFRINVSDPEPLPKPEALTMDSSYPFQPQPDYNMFQVFQIQPVSSFQSEMQSFPVNA